MEKETKRLLRKLVRLYDGQTKEFLLKYTDEVSGLNIEEQSKLAQELPARHLSAEILSDIQRIKNGEEPRFFTKDGQYKGLCVEEYKQRDFMTRQQRYVLSWAFGLVLSRSLQWL